MSWPCVLRSQLILPYRWWRAKRTAWSTSRVSSPSTSTDRWMNRWGWNTVTIHLNFVTFKNSHKSIQIYAQDTGKLPGGGNYEGPPIHTLTIFANPFIQVVPSVLNQQHLYHSWSIPPSLGRALHLRGGGGGGEPWRSAPHWWGLDHPGLHARCSWCWTQL